MIHSGSHIKDCELVEICEKIVHSGIDQISHQENGASDLFETYKGFMSSHHSRSKIIQFLQDRIVRDFSKLSPEDMCEFASVLRNIEKDGISGTSQFNHEFTLLDNTLETIEPYIVEEMNLLKVRDLANAYVGFTHPLASKSFEIIDVLEQKLTSMILDNKMTLPDQIDMLYEMSQK